MTDPTDLLERLAARLPHSAPPLDRLVAGGRRAVRRRRRAATLAGAAAVLMAVGAGVTVPRLVHQNDTATPAAPSDQGRDRATPTPPDGMRFVGVGRAVIAVPAQWPTSVSGCGFRGSLSDQSFVYLDDSTPPLTCDPDPRRTVVGVRDIDVADRDPQIIDQQLCPASRAPVCEGSIASPRDGVEFVIRSSGDTAVFRAVMDSFQRLPSDYVVVPEHQGSVVDIQHTLEAAGLEVEVADDVNGTATLVSDPVPGAVVRPGSVVHLTSSGASVVVTPAEPRAGDEVGLAFPTGLGRSRSYDLAIDRGDRWETVAGLLSATRPGERPRVIPLDQGANWTDHEVTGPGPDTIRLPADLEPGRYRACSDGVGLPSVCALFTVR